MEILWKKEVEFSAYTTPDKSDESYQETTYPGDVDEVKVLNETLKTVDLCFVDATPVLYFFDVDKSLFDTVTREY